MTGAAFLPVFLLLLCGTSRAQVSPNKLCIDNLNNDACQQIARDQDMNCQSVVAKTNCILDADENRPVLTVLEPEEAFLGANLVTSSATVIGEIVAENPPYQTVVIVRAGYLGGFEQLRGTKYCHPGYRHDELITKYVLEQLDWKAISLSCSNATTLTEQKFESLSGLFGNSCRPGRWTEDDELDASLKRQYPSLCQLCGTDGCNTIYRTPLNDSLSCLTNNGGDVAVSALRYSEAFFAVGANAQNFQYLCPNGTTTSSSNPCVWTSQLNRLIVTSTTSASTMQTYVQTKLASYVNTGNPNTPSSIEPHLALLLQLSRTDRINLITPLPLRTYVSERRSLPSIEDSIQCERTLTWSVTDDLERNKCNWLQYASLINGLQPVIRCSSSVENDTVSNLDNIKSGRADLAFIDATFGYIARQKGLSSVAYPETDTRKLSKIVIVVRNDTTWYNGLSSFRGKRICLPEYGGKEWLAFIDLLRTQRVLSDSCAYGKLFSDFVGESCAPGARSKDLDIADTDSDKLCAKCYPVDPVLPPKYCDADEKNKYYGSLGALTCVQEDNGDYAVIALNDLPLGYQRNYAEHQQFRVVARNGSLAAYNGFEVDESAPVTIIIAGEVVVENGTSKYNDTVLFLRELETVFGTSLQKPFKVFESFNGVRDLLFPDSTPGLTFGGTPNRYIDNLKTLLRNSETCSPISGGSFPTVLPSFAILFAVAALVRLL